MGFLRGTRELSFHDSAGEKKRDTIKPERRAANPAKKKKKDWLSVMRGQFNARHKPPDQAAFISLAARGTSQEPRVLRVTTGVGAGSHKYHHWEHKPKAAALHQVAPAQKHSLKKKK